MPPTSCKALIKDYCFNCTFAGVHYIADDTKHWSERLTWLGFIVLSWYGSALLIISSWDSFVNNPISFVVETTYTDWNTKMPAVAVCETSNDKMIFNVSDTIWTPDHLLDLEDALRDIAYFRGISYSLVELCFKSKKPDPQCPMDNYTYYANLVRSSCNQILKNCSYNGIPFDCCEYFLPMDTDIGRCYIINSIQTKDPKPFPMAVNQKSTRANLTFNVIVLSTMYTLGEDEVPTVTTLHSSTLKMQFGQKYTRYVAVKNVENDPNVLGTNYEKRACLFHEENKDGLYPFYSYSACTVLCRKREQLNICKCNDHFMLGTSENERCNISGMSCLHKYTTHLTTLKPRWATRPGLYCDCLPSCEETEITVIKDIQTPQRKERKKSTMQVILPQLPTERYKRNVVRSPLDLVVSIGGTAGLFVGASILSFIELAFYFTVRFAGNLWIERKKLLKNKNNRRRIQFSNRNILYT